MEESGQVRIELVNYKKTFVVDDNPDLWFPKGEKIITEEDVREELNNPDLLYPKVDYLGGEIE